MTDKPLKTSHEIRLALDCARLIIEEVLLKEMWPDSIPVTSWAAEQIRQDMAQIILKNGFERL